MATMMMLPGLRPATSGMQFTARPSARPSTQDRANKLSKSENGSLAANPELSVIEVEAKLRDCVRTRCADIQQGFQNYDCNQSLSVTKGEFRRVLETYCVPLTTEQFDAIMNKVDVNPNGTVRYCDFLDKFYGKDRKRTEKWKSGTQRYIQPQSPQEMNTDMVEKMLKEKLEKNLKNVVKAIRLYDYNRDGQIQKHELRKVLENYCFKMSDQQFDKLYQRYDFQHRGILNYREFLQHLGLHVEKRNQPPPPGLPGSLQWQQERPPQSKTAQMRRPDDSRLAGMSIHEIEVEFRTKMRENYANLKKMFLAFDKHLDGFIAIDELHSILNQFTIPTSDQLFAQLMDRFGIKASGKVSWELFLEKFQDPQSYSNGQTIPIKPNHKFFPIRGAEEKMDIKSIIRLLHDHVVNGYSSFKKAFLEIDKNRDGKISRKELRNVLNNFKFRISDGQFQELMILLDPQHTNVISYHKFLDLFEEKESREAHKWLVSCHKFNEQQKPAILAWETIEDILRQKISENWKTISEAIVKCDNLGSGRIRPRDLRKVIEGVCVPFSDDHFNNLMNRMEDRDEGGRVSYLEFFSHLGVSVRPGDVEGVSAQITKGSESMEQKRSSDLIARQNQADAFTVNRTGSMSALEILTRLRDRMSQHNVEIRKAFQIYSRKRKDKLQVVTKKDFRVILEKLGYYMDDEQFKELCSHLSFHNSHMTYADFVSNFEDPRIGPVTGELYKINNHRVNKIRGDEYSMRAEDVVHKLLVKLRENFEDLRGAFYKFDDDHNGILTKKNFRRMLDSFLFILNDEEFEKFCKILGVENKTRISYRDFLDAFEVRDTADGHKWLNSTHKYNEVKPMKLMTAEQVHAELADKAHRRYKDLAKAFRTMDSSSNGIISKKELRETLYKFMMPMTKEEFNKLWQRYDNPNKGFISHEDFLRHLSGDKFAPGDDKGTSYKITENSHQALEMHHQSQLLKQEVITQNQADRATFFSVQQVLQQLKDRIRDKHDDFQTAFKAYDKNKKGYLTAANLQQVLIDFNFFLDDDQYYDLLEHMNLSKPRSKLSYEEFLRVFEEGHIGNYAAPEKPVYYPQVEFSHLKPTEAEAKLKEQVTKNHSTLQSAFQAFDPQYTGKIPVPDFRRILDNFCFKLSESQFKQFIATINVSSDNMADYAAFLEPFGEAEPEDNENWLDAIKRRVQENPEPQPLSADEVDKHIRENVAAKFKAVARAMADIDYARIGVLSKEDFQEVLHKHIIRLSDDQFDSLWSRLCVNEFNNVDYQDFLRRYSLTDAPRPATSGGLPTRRIATGNSEYARSLHSSWSMGSRTARPFTPLINAEDTEKKLREKIQKHWRDIQKYCREADPENTGQTSQRDFKFIMGRCCIDLSEDDTRKLLLKYDLRNNSRFCYTEFLRHFVLNMQPQDEPDQAALLNRRKIQPTKLSPPPKPAESSARTRLHHCVTTSWKNMRRDFRNFDPNNVGYVYTDDFRQVLRNFNLNMSEDEFSNLINKYGEIQDDLVNYNDFIKAFLKPT